MDKTEGDRALLLSGQLSMTYCRLGPGRTQYKGCPSFEGSQGTEAPVCSCFQDQAGKREEAVGPGGSQGACEIISLSRRELQVQK